MSSYNKVIIAGHLGQDPELKYLPSGTAAVTVSVATNKHWTGKDGQKQERTDWHRVVAFAKTAELIGKHLHKGDQALFDGELQTRKWKDKDGNDKYTVEILTNHVTFLGKAGGGREQPPLTELAGTQVGTAPAAADTPAFSEEDIPF